ncbi:hypothetical protein WA026_015486 [Henosepilachna vigintioctopunctata]|uniref:Reverse transcriptase n=1 Tax=Henosepilachna vigintioctopunctata TaxID=420089 RepID=A0AAW1ULI8_9CUCU
MTITPVVSYANSPTYRLASWLNKHLKASIDCNFTQTVNNTVHLVNKIKDKMIPEEAVLISLDVSNLHTNIPTSEVVQIVKSKLLNGSISDIKAEELIKLLNLCLKQNFLSFN